MRVRRQSEKQPYKRVKIAKSRGYLAIVCLLHVFLWTSLYVVCSTLYMTISTLATDETILVPAVVTGATVRLCVLCLTICSNLHQGLLSIIYVTLYNVSSALSKTTQTEIKNLTRLRVQRLATIALQLSVIAWLISSGLSVTFTLARHPRCSPATTIGLSSINVTRICVIQRCTIAASLVAL
jgi:hypothetical protein